MHSQAIIMIIYVSYQRFLSKIYMYETIHSHVFMPKLNDNRVKIAYKLLIAY